MNPNNPFNTSGQNPRVQSFLESLKNRTVSPGAENPNLSGMESFIERRRVEEQRRNEYFRTRSREFNEVYSLTKKREEKRIIEIHRHLQALAKSVRRLKNEIKVAVASEVVEASPYQENIFDHLMSLIHLAKTETDKASSWLAMYNSRSKKKSYYWAMAGRGGTKYTQAIDRSLATSVG